MKALPSLTRRSSSRPPDDALDETAVDSSQPSGPRGRERRSWVPRLVEEGFLVLFAALLTLYLEWPLISNPSAYQTDAAIHEWWMRRFRDPELFNDPLTEAVLEAAWVPPGLRFTYGLAANFVDPVGFAEWAPVLLAPVSAWLVFRIVRAHTTWPAAAWLGAALFLLSWEVHKFSGGHSRAYVHPIVLSCVLLAVRRKDAGAAVVPGLGALFYPPAGIVAGAIFGLSSLRFRPRPRIDKRRFLFAIASGILLALVLLVPRALSENPPEILTRAEVQDLPEFGPQGQMHFFKATLHSQLRGNYGGFYLKKSGNVLLAAVFLVLLARLWVRPRIAPEVWAMAAAALLMFGAAYAVLFRLYLPHRYTYPLVPFFAIVLAVSWRPLWEATVRWLKQPFLWFPFAVAVSLLALYLALVASPLGPLWERDYFGTWLSENARLFVIVVAVGVVLAALAVKLRSFPKVTAWGLVASAVAGGIFLPGLADLGVRQSARWICDKPVHHYLATVPKDYVIAGDPTTSSCIPLAARRPVVISRKLYQPWDRAYLEVVRPRMFDVLQAYYGDSPDDIVELRTKYGADLLVTREVELNRTRWRPRMQPFTSFVNGLLAENPRGPASARLPKGCITWAAGGTTVYDLKCVASTISS